MLDGTDILELHIEEVTGNVQIKDKQGIQDYPSLDLKDLHLMIINIGNTLTPKVPFFYIRVLAGMHVLHHSEHKQ
ncbi:MAG: hypothetical protein AB7C91_13625 [Sphaerochaeta sp.]|uniref:hypothetical protein n=1 Tax=Sphaerochaeta sp. TaxID=1972642 RepID=UPI003D0B11E1